MQPERPVQTTLAFHSSRIVIDVGVLIAMAAMSFPFVVSEAGDRSGLNADALPAILLLLPIFAVTLIPDHTRPLHRFAGWFSLAFGFAALPYSVVKMLDAAVLADSLNGSLGLGPRLLVVGCTVTLIGIGIGIYRSLLGLPSGGTPGRAAPFRTRSGKPVAASAGPTPTGAKSPPMSEGVQNPTQAPPTPPFDDAVAAPQRSDQPAIIFPGIGAVAREADVEPADDLFNTAERADAAIDDELMGIFGTPDETEPQDS